MGHAAIDNQTPFAFVASFAMDEAGRPVVVPLVQATYDLRGPHGPALAEKQLPPSLAGELWGEDAATSSYKIEPAFAFMKPATDVALIGHAHAPRAGTTDMTVAFRVGPVGKAVRVVGDRVWVRALGATGATRPLPFERMPLRYEHAFGGWDRSSPDAAKHGVEARNPVGRGFRARHGVFEEGVRLPNIEDPGDPVKDYGHSVAPAGFGFMSPGWQPRAALGGTYDAAWSKERMPLLPGDFDRRFFNAASLGLVAPGYLRGNEPVLVDNASARGRLAFNLPGAPLLACRVSRRHAEDARVEMRLDTVVVDTDADQLLLLYRGYAPLREGPHDVKAIEIKASGP